MHVKATALLTHEWASQQSQVQRLQTVIQLACLQHDQVKMSKFTNKFSFSVFVSALGQKTKQLSTERAQGEFFCLWQVLETQCNHQLAYPGLCLYLGHGFFGQGSTDVKDQ